jgi:hypothetical protein
MEKDLRRKEEMTSEYYALAKMLEVEIAKLTPILDTIEVVRTSMNILENELGIGPKSLEEKDDKD